MEKDKITLETQITVKQAYLVMFEYSERYWTSYNKPNEIGDLLSDLSLWDSKEGKTPMDSSIFPEWVECAEKVIDDENSNEGYRRADIKLIK